MSAARVGAWLTAVSTGLAIAEAVLRIKDRKKADQVAALEKRVAELEKKLKAEPAPP